MSDTPSSQGPGKTCPQCGNPLPAGVLDGLCPACLLKQGAAADTAFPNDAAAFQPPDIAEVARMFPHLEILSLLGKGGMGAVYKARQPSLDRFVALKILPPQTGMAPGFVERFNREARALAKLIHPNIVTVHEFGQVNGMPFFIMEFVDGVNLRELERAGKLSPREALQIVPQICEALQFAHDEGIVHRDIKPENILIDKKGRVKIADFGIAKILGVAAEPSLTETRGTIGTPNYMAPEQMEKPSTVDHRADIFSLGVVFYEMLTGELPLGKFSPPSERKIAVDVRLDDVVLRALEKDPERRYQQASQVRTAVNEITSTAPPPVVPPATPVPPTPTAADILARDYTLSIRSCYRRAWALMRKDFWPILGITLLMLALLSFASSAGNVLEMKAHGDSLTGTSALLLLVYGPLMGGLSLYYLKKIRGESTTVEAAFSGFGNRFLHLFLAGFASWVLISIGFVCLVLPGIYLWVAWMFALTIAIDQQLDFWSAMELSRKVVTRHWFKLFGLLIVGLLWCFVGVLCLFFGLFVAIPVMLIAATYAYEDIFGAAARAGSPQPALGPAGTVVSPVAVIKDGWKRIPTAGFIALAVAILAIVIFARVHWRRERERFRSALTSDDEQTAQAQVDTTSPSLSYAFTPVFQRSLGFRRDFLNLDRDKAETVPQDIAGNLGDGSNETAARFWEGLDIAQNSPRVKYVNWLSENGADVMYVGDGKIIGFNGVFLTAHGANAANWDDWNSFTADEVRNAFETAQYAGSSSGLYHSAMRLESREPGGPEVSALTRDQSVNYFFKTAAGTMGVLQLAGFSDDRKTANIRYKLMQPYSDENRASAPNGTRASPEDLSARIDAALMMNLMQDRDALLRSVAVDAAKAGQIEMVKKALGNVTMITDQGEASLDVVRILVKHGQRKQATEIADNIMQIDLRDRALAEVAR